MFVQVTKTLRGMDAGVSLEKKTGIKLVSPDKKQPRTINAQ